MKDLDELLREDGRSWQPARVPAPDLDAARARARRARLRAGAALVAVAVMAVGGLAVLSQWTPGIPAVPAPMRTPTAPAPTDSSPTAATSTGSLAALTDAVHAQSVRFGIPAQADAVLATWLAAQEFLPAEGDETAGDTAVWVVQVQGEFSCDTCQTTGSAPEPSVSTLVVVLNADDFALRWYELGDVTRPLANLGTVVHLDPDGSTGLLSFTRAVDDNAGDFGTPVSGEAVLTTWLDATEFLPFGDAGPAGDTQVWLVQLRGEFSCDDCRPTSSGPEPSASVLTLVLDAHSFERYYAEPGDVTRPLENLGVVQAVDLHRIA